MKVLLVLLATNIISRPLISSRFTYTKMNWLELWEPLYDSTQLVLLPQGRIKCQEQKPSLVVDTFFSVILVPEVIKLVKSFLVTCMQFNFILEPSSLWSCHFIIVHHGLSHKYDIYVLILALQLFISLSYLLWWYIFNAFIVVLALCAKDIPHTIALTIPKKRKPSR